MSTDQIWAALKAAAQAGDEPTFLERLTDLKLAVLYQRKPLPKTEP
jgi:tetraacyldisaccharide-1-P 4'-kinase